MKGLILVRKDKEDDCLRTVTPISNPDLLGQEFAENCFLTLYSEGKLPLSLLIHGPRGVGKATLAYRISRFLLTQKNLILPAMDNLFSDKSARPNVKSLWTDLNQPTCRRMISGGHADFLIIEPEVNNTTRKYQKEITVDEIRKVNSFLHKTPSEGGWRIVIIDSVDQLNTNAANSILKILEEPPSYAIIILISHNPGGLLPTIRSRCMGLRVKSLSNNTIRKLLRNHIPTLAENEISDILEICDGSIGLAIKLIENGGLKIYHEISKLMLKLPNVEVLEILNFIESLNDNNSNISMEIAFISIDRLLIEYTKKLVLENKNGVDRWVEVWEEISKIIRNTRKLNLDEKLSLTNIFNLMKEVSFHWNLKQQ